MSRVQGAAMVLMSKDKTMIVVNNCFSIWNRICSNNFIKKISVFCSFFFLLL